MVKHDDEEKEPEEATEQEEEESGEESEKISLGISKDDIVLILLSVVTGIAIGFLISKIFEIREDQRELNHKLDLMAYMQNQRNQEYFFPNKPYNPSELSPRVITKERSDESDIAQMRPRVIRDPETGGVIGVEDDSMYGHEDWVIKKNGNGEIVDVYRK